MKPKTLLKSGTVVWNADASGYRVAILRGAEIVEEYAAGNNPHDSMQPASPGYPTVPQSTLRKWARQTALEMAEEAGIPSASVTRDKELEVEAEFN